MYVCGKSGNMWLKTLLNSNVSKYLLMENERHLYMHEEEKKEENGMGKK